MKAILLACIFLSAAVYSDVLYRSLRFCDCGELGWRINDYSVAWEGNDTLITMNVICKKGAQMPEFFHQVHINVSDCASLNIEECANSTTVHVSNVNCQDANITSMDRETCAVAMMIAEHQMHQLLLPPFLRPGGVCICGVNDELTTSDDSSESSESSAQSHSNRSSTSEVSNASIDSNHADESAETEGS